MRYCKKMDERLMREIKQKNPKTIQKLKDIWYNERNAGYHPHYDTSRYHFLNLHSYFEGNHTVELRGFNSTLHAGKVKAYILLALAINNQALTQKKATYKKTQEENVIKQGYEDFDINITPLKVALAESRKTRAI